MVFVVQQSDLVSQVTDLSLIKSLFTKARKEEGFFSVATELEKLSPEDQKLYRGLLENTYLMRLNGHLSKLGPSGLISSRELKRLYYQKSQGGFHQVF